MSGQTRSKDSSPGNQGTDFEKLLVLYGEGMEGRRLLLDLALETYDVFATRANGSIMLATMNDANYAKALNIVDKKRMVVIEDLPRDCDYFNSVLYHLIKRGKSCRVTMLSCKELPQYVIDNPEQFRTMKFDESACDRSPDAFPEMRTTESREKYRSAFAMLLLSKYMENHEK
jgi:hypothetical protein